MKRYEIGAEDVDAMIAKAVADRGADWKWRDHYDDMDCIYYVTKEWAEEYAEECGDKLDVGPACLVGKIFHDLDPELDALLIDCNPDPIEAVFGVYTGGVENSSDVLYEAVHGDIAVEITGRALVKLAVAQKAQDMSQTWGEAMREALEVGND